MLASRFLDDVLAEAGQELEGAADVVWAAGFRYSSSLDEPRPLGLMLEEGSYRLLTFTIAFGAARRGRVSMIFPAVGRGRAPMPKPAPVADTASQEWEEGFSASVSAAAVRLDAVLARIELPLSLLAGLAPGALVPLPGARLDRVTLTALDGRAVAEGRLGQSQSFRAIRLGTPGGGEE